MGRNAPGFGLLGLAVVFILLAVIVLRMGATSWTTIEGGCAVLLLALTFAFVTFGGTLLVTPFFSQWSEFEERFRRAREIFLLFSGTFSTIVGFYFAAAVSQAPSSLLITESFNADKGEFRWSLPVGSPLSCATKRKIGMTMSYVYPK